MNDDCVETLKSGLQETLQNPRVAAIWPTVSTTNGNFDPQPSERLFYVDVYQSHTDALILRSARQLLAGHRYALRVFDSGSKSWNYAAGMLEHFDSDANRSEYRYSLLRLKTMENAPTEVIAIDDEGKTGPVLSDYEFFRTVPFLKAIHRDAVCPLLNSMAFRSVRAGERIITQGDSGNTCYIVQSGHCKVLIEKNGDSHVISRIGPREFVGEMGLLTGEHRSAHVVAETDMHLWSIDRGLFQTLMDTFPEVGTFLTEIIAERFATRKLTADRKIGKYRITDIIGRGGFAIVYKGYHEDLNRPVAVKMLHHDMALNPEFLGNFRKEARTIANLNCENIIKVYDIEERFRTVFIIMELLEGMTVRQVLDETGPISEKETVSILLKVCQGLKYAHDRGLVHQDIKPGNIFLLPDGGVKILDFGLACRCGTETFLSGTPYYMSPEQVECLPVDERADIYAMGLTAYEMLSGQRPLPETDPFTVMNLRVHQPLPDPSDVLPSIHPDLRRFIRRACARHPERRYPNVSSVVDALQPLADRLGLLANRAPASKRKMSTLFLVYREDQHLALNKLMEEFSDKVKAEGILLKAADFEDMLT